jgi:hypothetical protein
MHPISSRLAVFIVLAANDGGYTDRDPEILLMAEEIVGLLSEGEFETYADEYDDSRCRWEVSRAASTVCLN